VYKAYDYDGELLSSYAKVNKTQEEFNKFVQQYILGTSDHYGFIDKVRGLDKLSRIQADPVYGYTKS
ncbi:MAG: hypothetical protein QME73_12850, partial [Bacillota bacterium]|nr:hypothetical protein [Bacillota bacterium]